MWFMNAWSHLARSVRWYGDGQISAESAFNEPLVNAEIVQVVPVPKLTVSRRNQELQSLSERATATLRIPAWLASGSECWGRRLSRG